HYIELVGKVVLLLEALRDEPEGLGLQELATRTEMVKSSVHRILNSLKKHGYVEQESVGGPYRLGLQVLTLARGLNGGIKLVEVARPYLRELVEAYDESAYLAVMRAERGLFVDVQETRRDLRLVGPLGAEVHFHATAAGKAMAAFLPPARRAALLKEAKLAQLTAKTLTKRTDVEQDWEEVRRRGFAANNEETIVGAVFLAAPVFDARQNVCASLSVGIPKARYSAELGKKIAEHLKDAARRLSETLGSAGYAH
ncbi:MAG: IclR family transcriptional regulator, partial [Blastocatellia bacterium]